MQISQSKIDLAGWTDGEEVVISGQVLLLYQFKLILVSEWPILKLHHHPTNLPYFKHSKRVISPVQLSLSIKNQFLQIGYLVGYFQVHF